MATRHLGLHPGHAVEDLVVVDGQEEEYERSRGCGNAEFAADQVGHEDRGNERDERAEAQGQEAVDRCDDLTQELANQRDEHRQRTRESVGDRLVVMVCEPDAIRPRCGHARQ